MTTVEQIRRALDGDVDGVLVSVSRFVELTDSDAGIEELFQTLCVEIATEPAPGKVRRQNAAFAIVSLLAKAGRRAKLPDGIVRLASILKLEEDRDVQAQLGQACALMLTAGVEVSDAESVHLVQLFQALSIAGVSAQSRRAAAAALSQLGRQAIAGVPGLLNHVMRARQAMNATQMLDVSGVLEWSKRYKDLEKIWIVAPRFIDDENAEVFDAVLGYLRRNIDVTYFVAARDCRNPGGRFTRLRRRLLDKAGKGAMRRLHTAPVSTDSVLWLQTDHVIGNAHLVGAHGAVGWQYFRKEGKPWVAFRMEQYQLSVMISDVTTWLEKHRRRRSEADHDDLAAARQRHSQGRKP